MGLYRIDHLCASDDGTDADAAVFTGTDADFDAAVHCFYGADAGTIGRMGHWTDQSASAAQLWYQSWFQFVCICDCGTGNGHTDSGIWPRCALLGWCGIGTAQCNSCIYAGTAALPAGSRKKGSRSCVRTAYRKQEQSVNGRNHFQSG